jgi:hypothetical protein
MGGQSVGELPKTDKDLPSSQSPAVKAQMPALEVVRDVWDGQAKLHSKGSQYLPQDPAERPPNYHTRLKRSVFFNVFRKTVDGLVGFVFRKDPVLGDDVPAVIKGDQNGKGGHAENIDNAGTHIDVFLRDLMLDAMTAGHAAILVDYPNTDGQVLTLGDEQTRKIRPYWVPIKKDNIVSWRTTIEDGRLVLTQLVLRECTYVPDGRFGEQKQERYRVLYRDGTVGYDLLEIGEDKKSVVVIEQGVYANQVEIPVAEIVTSGKCSLFVSDPPLLDLAYLNIAHYQLWSDYANSLHKTCVPVFFTAGVVPPGEEGKFIISPDAGVNASNPQAKADYISHSGDALAASKDAIEGLEENMASLGIAMLATQKRVAETAEAKRIGKADTDSALSVTARGLQDGAERALDFHARYLRLDDGGSIQINRDFEDMSMPADLMVAWATLAEKLSLPLRVVLEALQEGGRIPPDVNLDDLEAEVAANAAAAADQAHQQAMDMAAMKTAQPAAKPLPGQTIP